MNYQCLWYAYTRTKKEVISELVFVSALLVQFPNLNAKNRHLPIDVHVDVLQNGLPVTYLLISALLNIRPSY